MILVSSCLAGFKVRYNGTSAQNDVISWLASHGQAITVCPEIMAGFAIPRPAAEIVGGNAQNVLDGMARVRENNGKDVTASYISGARMVLKIALKNKVQAAFLKENSPSCGVNNVYSGNFDGHLLLGTGVTACILKNAGIQVYSETDLDYIKIKSFVSPDIAAEFAAEFGSFSQQVQSERKDI